MSTISRADNSNDIQPQDIIPLEQKHKDAMLNLVLAWAELDVNLGVMLSVVRGLPLDEGASKYGKKRAVDKLNELVSIYEESADLDLKELPEEIINWLKEIREQEADALRRFRKYHKEYSGLRNLVAHARCIGVWSKDPKHIVFFPFERYDYGELAVEGASIEKMINATSLAKRFSSKVPEFISQFEKLRALLE